jgi:FtsH-binding integral membrane protein
MASGIQAVIYPVKDVERANTTMKRVAYWVCTGLVVFFIGSGGLAYATQVPDVVQGAVALGFPVHFIVLLGVWKVLGSIAILVPGFPLIKEWAYAGILFDLTGAASASIAIGGEWWHVTAPLSIAVLVAASWALRPESRRLQCATSAMLGMRPTQG